MKCAKKLIITMRRLIRVINHGIGTLSASSQGKYSERTDDVKRLRHEMLDENFGSFRTDKENLLRDRKAFSRDVGRAFYGLIAE